MSYLEDIINGIEEQNRIRLSQEEKDNINELVGAHEFDEEAAKQFVNFYTNINYKNDFPKSLARFLNTSLSNIFTLNDSDIVDLLEDKTAQIIPSQETLGLTQEHITKLFLKSQQAKELKRHFYKSNTSYKRGINNYLLKKVIKILEVLANSWTESFKVENLNYENYSIIEIAKPVFIRSLKAHINDIKFVTFLCQNNYDNNKTTKEAIDQTMQLLEHLIVINAHALMPHHIETDCNLKDHEKQHFTAFFRKNDSFLRSYKLDENYIKRAIVVNELLERLSKYKGFRRKDRGIGTAARYNESFSNIILSALSGDEKSLDIIRRELRFLSYYDPKEKPLCKVFPQMMKVIMMEIPGYEIINFLGDGSYKRTYLARHQDFGEDVALKIIDIPTLAKQPNVQRAIKTKLGNDFNGNIEEALIKIFQEEAKVMFRATTKRSPNIPIIFEAKYDATTKQYRIVEELGDATLAHILLQKKKLGPIPADHYLSQISDGVKQLHSLGFVHGDLKPENILVNKDNSIRIIDFGWSSQIPLLSEHYDDPRYLTNLLTCAPEVFDGKHPDEKSDIWSIGVIAYRMLTGEWPFNHEFVASEAKWRILSLDEKQKYTQQIREDIENKKHNIKYLDRLRSGHAFDEEHQFYIANRTDFDRFIENLVEFVSNAVQYNPSSRILKTELLGQR